MSLLPLITFWMKSKTLPIPLVSSHQNCALDCPVSYSEIESTIFQLGSHKAPGLDGIPAFFLSGLLGYCEIWCF